MKRILPILILLLVATVCYAKRNLPERHYQTQWAIAHGGMTEYRLSDNTRVDVLLEHYAVEVDFVDKFYEGVGQALYYAYMTGKQPGLVLIIEKDDDISMRRLQRAKYLCDRLRIKLWTVGK